MSNAVEHWPTQGIENSGRGDRAPMKYEHEVNPSNGFLFDDINAIMKGEMHIDLMFRYRGIKRVFFS